MNATNTWRCQYPTANGEPCKRNGMFMADGRYQLCGQHLFRYIETATNRKVVVESAKGFRHPK